MGINSLLKLVTMSLLVIALAACDKNLEEQREVSIDSNFELASSTWFFQNVSAVGLIGGVETTDDDPNPTGFITFNPDGTGIAEFGINLLDRPYGKTEEITWERRTDREVVITESDGDVDVWTLFRANDNIIEADWEVFISAQNQATFTATLTPNP